MKKAITSILSITLLLSAFTLNSWATNSKVTSADVKTQLDAVAQQSSSAVLASGNNGFFVTWGNDAAITSILKSGVPCKELTDAYLASLKTAVKANDGKLFYNKVENASAYTNTLTNLALMGLDGTQFEGYNLLAQLLAMPRESIVGVNVNLYQCAATLRAVEKYDDVIADKTLKSDLITSLTNRFKDNVDNATGYDNWGVSTDNNGHVIAALAPYYNTNETVKSQLDKTLAWNETMKKETGYASDLQWTKDANPSGTALSLLALSSVKDYDKAEVAYKLLTGFKEADADTFGSSFYDQDALRGLVAYYELLLAGEVEESTTQVPSTVPAQPSTTVATTTPSTTSPNKGSGTSIPKTGKNSIATLMFLSAAGASAIMMIQCRKKKEA